MIQVQNSYLDHIQRSKYLSKLSRPQNVVYPGALSAGTCLLLGGSVITALLCYVFFLSAYSIAAGYNNIHDQKTDVINERDDNPLIKHIIPKTTLKLFFFGNLAVLLLIQGFLEQPATIILASLYLLLSFLYSNPTFRLQSRGWWAIAVLCICYGCLPFLVGYFQSQNDIGLELVLVAIYMFLILFPLVTSKDYKDVKGDKLTGKNTALVLYGVRTVRVSSLLAAVFTLTIGLVGAYLYEMNLLLIGLLLAIYVILCYELHRSKGQMGRLLKKIFLLVILMLSLLFVVGLVG